MIMVKNLIRNLNTTKTLIDTLKPILSPSGIKIELKEYKENYDEVFVIYIAKCLEDEIEITFMINEKLVLCNPCYKISDLGFVPYKIFRELIDLAQILKEDLVVGG